MPHCPQKSTRLIKFLGKATLKHRKQDFGFGSFPELDFLDFENPLPPDGSVTGTDCALCTAEAAEAQSLSTELLALEYLTSFLRAAANLRSEKSRLRDRFKLSKRCSRLLVGPSPIPWRVCWRITKGRLRDRRPCFRCLCRGYSISVTRPTYPSYNCCA